MFWDCVILILLVINIFYIPIKLIFQDSKSGFVLPYILSVLLNDIPGWAFLLDICINFNTAYYYRGAIIRARSLIFKTYLNNKFFWDLIVVIPFIISLKLKIPYMDLVLFLRTNKMRKILQNFELLLNLP